MAAAGGGFGGVSMAGFQGGPHDLEAILAEQLQALHKVIFDNQRASFLAGTQSRSITNMEAELAKLESENQRMRTQLANAGLVPDDAGFGPGETGCTLEAPASKASGTSKKVVMSSPVVSLPGWCGDVDVSDADELPRLPDRSDGQPAAEMVPVVPTPQALPPLNKAPTMPAAATAPRPLTQSASSLSSQKEVIRFDQKKTIKFEEPEAGSIGEVEFENDEGDIVKATIRPSVGNASQLRETLDFLSKVPLFKRLPQDQYPTLAAACYTCEYPKGSVLIRQGDAGDEFFVIVDGKVSVCVEGKQVASLGAGDYFGENALLRNEPRTATIAAESEVSCLKIGRERFQDLGLHEKLEFPKREESGRKPKAVFADAAAMKEKLRVAMAKPPYDVRNFYHETGVMQKIARSSIFDNVTLSVIAFNALWIAIDTDHNGADILLNADTVFVVMETCFATYFFGEWFIRFCSFKKKTDGLRDAWFVFDSALVSLMVGETGLMNCIVLIMGGGSSSGLGNASILRLFRLLRLSRMARMARLLRAMPELMVLIKGMVVAMRSVFFTLCLLAGIIYVFGIMFVQLLKGTPNGDNYFPTVPDAMNSLLLDGTLPDQAQIINDVGDEGWVYRFLVLFYILLASLTVMNMLVGVLCEVVSVVSAVEKESLLVNYVKGTLLHMLQTSGLDADGDHQIARNEFEALLQNPGAAKALQEVGVDVIGLVDFTDFIFKDGKQLSFPDFMDMVLQLRGSNTATVKDLVDLRKVVMSEIEKTTGKTTQVVSDILVAIGHGTAVAGGPGAGFPAASPPQNQNLMFTPAMGQSMVAPQNAMMSPQNMMVVPMDAGNIATPITMMPMGSMQMQQVASTEVAGLNWATAAASRLSAAAGELSAAAGELSTRNRMRNERSNTLERAS